MPNVQQCVPLTCWKFFELNFTEFFWVWKYPIGCPRLTAPPCGFTLAGSKFSFFMLARTTALKASLISHCATSSALIPVCFSSWISFKNNKINPIFSLFLKARFGFFFENGNKKFRMSKIAQNFKMSGKLAKNSKYRGNS